MIHPGCCQLCDHQDRGHHRRKVATPLRGSRSKSDGFQKCPDRLMTMRAEDPGVASSFDSAKRESPAERNFDEYQENYASLPFEPVQEHYRRKRLVEVLEKYLPARVIEIGCGRESVFQHWSPAHDATIVEPIEEHLDSCQEAITSIENIQLTTFTGTLEEYCEISQAENSFDLAILSSVLHEFPDPIAALYQVHSILNRQGFIVLITTNPHSIHRLLGVDLGILKSTSEGTSTELQMNQSAAWDMDQLRQMLARTNFEVVEQFSSFPKLLSHAQMQEALDKDFIGQEFLDGMFALSPYLERHGSEIFTIAVRR